MFRGLQRKILSATPQPSGFRLAAFTKMINLIPTIEKINLTKYYRKRFLAVLLGFSATAFFAGSIFLISPYRLAEEKTATILKSVGIGQTLTTSLEASNPEFVIKDIQKKLDTLSLKKNAIPVNLIISSILADKPADTTINGITYKKKDTGAEIEVRGIAGNRDSLLSFTRALEDEPLFKKVNVPVSSFVKDRNLDFSIQITANVKMP